MYFRYALMLRLPVIAISLAALALPFAANASRVIAFDRTSAKPNERLTVTSALNQAARLYLVRRQLAGTIRSRSDRRLSFIGAVPARGSLTFSLPPLDAGTYSVAVWCRRCRDGTFSTQAARLRVLPTAGCPVTRPNGSRPPGQPPSRLWHGNGLLWAGLDADGVYTIPRDRVEPDGSIFDKLLWVTPPPWNAPTISGERIDGAAPPLNVLAVNLGESSNATMPSFRSAVSFPTPGCWRLTARLGDVSLMYVVRIAIRD